MTGRWAGDRLHLEVGDDGAGGAVIIPGGGLDGIRQRLVAFDGTLSLAEPPTGGTALIMDLPVAAHQGSGQLPR